MRILLITPPRFQGIPVSRLERVEGPDKNVICPPLDLAYLSAIIKKSSKSHTVKIIDANAENLTYREFKKQVFKFFPDTVIIKGVINTLQHDLKIAKDYKAYNPEAKVILSSFTCLGIRKWILNRYKFIDGFAAGELEAFAEDISSGTKLEMISGMSTRKKYDTEIRIIERLDELPYPDWDALPRVNYVAAPGILPWFMLFSSKGCPWGRCSFCLLGGNIKRAFKYRTRNHISVVDELELLIQKMRLKSFLFFDATFTAPGHSELICSEMITRGIDIPWICNGRVDMINKKMLELMSRAGCIEVTYGVETANDNVLRCINKGFNAHDVKKAFKLTRQAGIEPGANIMLGLPGESWHSFWKTILFILRLNPRYVIFTIAVPYPGTRFFEYCRRHGFITTFDWRKYDQAHDDVIIRTEYLNPDDIRKMQKIAYKIWYTFKYITNWPLLVFDPREWSGFINKVRNYFLKLEYIR